MKKEKTLIYLSTCAMDKQGRPNAFMTQELPWLTEHFQQVWVIGHYGKQAFHAGDEVDKPVFKRAHSFGLWIWAWANALKDKQVHKELQQLRADGKSSPVYSLKVLAFAARSWKMHGWVEKSLKDCAEETTTLYSFWMSYDAYAGALSKQKHPGLHFVTRGHAFDISRERNAVNPYLMKDAIAQYADGLYLISQQAKQQYMEYMQGRVKEEKVHALAMGSKGVELHQRKEPPFFSKGQFCLVSCAMIIPIKQVPMLVDALSQWDGKPLHWLHMGGGEGEEALRTYAKEKLAGNASVSYELIGEVKPEQIEAIYKERAFDVIVNTSRLEGVPVSLMEAMRFGIPAVAPAVGGIPELVDDTVGMLFDAEEGAQGVLKALKAMAALSREQAERLRLNAQNRWNESYRSEALLPKLFPQEECHEDPDR